MRYKTLISIQIGLWSCIIVFLISIFGYTLYKDFNRESIDTFGNGDEAEYTVKVADTKVIKIDFVSEEVEIVMSNEEDIRIVQATSYNLKEEDRLRIKSSGKIINIDKKKINYSFNFLDGLNKSETITIYIPKNFNKDLEVKTVSGSINLQDLQLEKIRCSSTSGYIKIEDLQIQEELNLKSVSGDITLNQVNSNLIDINTTSGRIETYKVIAKTIRSTTTSGNVEFMGTCNKFKHNTTSGNLEASFNKMFKEATISSVSGDVNIEIHENDGFKVEYDTVSGDLTSKFSLDNYMYKKDIAKIIVKTTSGNLKIEK